MVGFCRLIWYALAGLFRSRASLEVEILVLRHQLNILTTQITERPTLSNFDRLIFAGLYSMAPNTLSALALSARRVTTMEAVSDLPREVLTRSSAVCPSSATINWCTGSRARQKASNGLRKNHNLEEPSDRGLAALRSGTGPSIM